MNVRQKVLTEMNGNSKTENNLSLIKQDERLAADISYYGLPAVKHSHYHWKTALCFLSEALSGAPQVIAAVIHFCGNKKDYNLVRAGRYLALAGSFISPALLISELHFPKRWFNMLRIFRSTSSMSIGNMSLTTFGICSGLTGIGQILEDLGHKSPGRLLSSTLNIPAAAAGGMICLYPGTELEGTCSPLWADSHPLLSPLFAATGLATGAAALTIASHWLATSKQGRIQLNRFSILAMSVQLAGACLLKETLRNRNGVSLQRTSHALIYRFGVLGFGIILPLAMRLACAISPPRTRRNQLSNSELAASAATITGSFLLYKVILDAGNASAGNPTEYLESAHNRPIRKKREKAGKSKRSNGRLGGICLSLLAVAGGIATAFLKRR